jgi:hypothetical protein
MNELFKDLEMAVASILLVFGVYLIYDAVSSSSADSPGRLIGGAVLSSLALVMGHSSVRLAYSVREWKRKAQSSPRNTSTPQV